MALSVLEDSNGTHWRLRIQQGWGRECKLRQKRERESSVRPAAGQIAFRLQGLHEIVGCMQVGGWGTDWVGSSGMEWQYGDGGFGCICCKPLAHQGSS